MKKIIFISLVAILVTGCTIERLDYNAIDETMDKVFSQKAYPTNTSSKGYSYYLPKGVRKEGVTEYNEILYSNGNKYYLYVDVISYYNKAEHNFKENKMSHLSKSLNFKDKKGYIEVTKIKESYFIEILYNYAKIEVLVGEKHLNKAIIDASYVLSTIRYNDIIIKATVKSEKYVGKEELFNLFEPKRKEGNFLDYVNEYDEYQDEKNEIPDEDKLTFEESKEIVID